MEYDIRLSNFDIEIEKIHAYEYEYVLWFSVCKQND